VDRPGKLKQSSKDTILRHVRTTFADWKDDSIVRITVSIRPGPQMGRFSTRDA
jgi:hypothetical protein